MTTEEPTQLDRIEAKLDEVLKLLRRPKLKIDFSSGTSEEQRQKFAEAFKREFTAADRKRSRAMFLEGEPAAKRSRWKTAAAMVGAVLGFVAVAALGLWLWVEFIRAVA